MSEVSKVNAVAIADIETINGVASADIETINSVDFVTGFSNNYSVQIGNNNAYPPDYSYLKVANPSSYNFIADSGGDGGTTAPYGDTPFSISIWFQQDVFVASPFISKAKGSPSAYREWQMNFHSGKYVWFKLMDSANNDIAIYDTTQDWSSLSSGWHHLVLKYGAPSGSADGAGADRAGGIARRDSMYYYMDGVRYNNGSTAFPMCYDAATATYVPCYSGLRTSTAATVNIGGFNPGGNQTFRGRMDEVSVWTKALTDADVTAIYNSGTPGDLSLSSSLKSWWRMGDNNGGTGTTVTDVQGVATAAAYDGTSAGWSATSGFDTDVPP
jgi:hypothetical protein